MSHVSEGMLQAYLDDELTASELSTVHSHVESCAECAADLQSLKSMNAEVHAALVLVEHPVPAARAPRPAPIEFAPARRGLLGEIPRQFLRAAVVLLAIAGVVSAAIPGSPLRRWIENIFTDEPEPSAVQTPVPAPTQQTVAPTPEPINLFVTPENGRITFSLLKLSPGVELHVKLVDNDSGTLQYTDGNARNAKGSGRLTIADHGPGTITIQIPRSAPTASVEVDGRLWWFREGGVLQTEGPVYNRQGDEEVVYRTRS